VDSYLPAVCCIPLPKERLASSFYTNSRMKTVTFKQEELLSLFGVTVRTPSLSILPPKLSDCISLFLHHKENDKEKIINKDSEFQPSITEFLIDGIKRIKPGLLTLDDILFFSGITDQIGYYCSFIKGVGYYVFIDASEANYQTEVSQTISSEIVWEKTINFTTKNINDPIIIGVGCKSEESSILEKQTITFDEIGIAEVQTSLTKSLGDFKLQIFMRFSHIFFFYF